MERTAATPMLDLRADVPVLQREIDGRRIVYLDSAATSLTPEPVIAAMDHYYRVSRASVHRGVYTLAAEATAAFESARERIAAFTGADARGTIFTANATAAINLVAYAWALDALGPRDAILVTRMEHHSNVVPWHLASRRTGAAVRWLDVDDDGLLDLEALDRELERGDVRVVAVTHVSNVLGTINPIEAVVERARAAGAVTVVDGAQAVPQLPVDVRAIGADFYAWTAHKALGPTGIGILHGRPELLERMSPFLGGGHMIRTVEDDHSTWAELPGKYEAGTSQIAEAIGLGAAVDYLSTIGMEQVRAHERALTARALAAIAEIPGVAVHGPPDADRRGGLVSLALDGMHPHDVAELLNRDNVCVRAGHHCAQPLMRRLGVTATVRTSFGPYNVEDDVDALVDSLGRAREVFGL